MNERIRELAEQAEMSVKWGDPNNYDDYHRAMDEWQEKFAELIVRECASIAGMNDDDTLSEGDIRARSIKRQIKEHFRVE